MCQSVNKFAKKTSQTNKKSAALSLTRGMHRLSKRRLGHRICTYSLSLEQSDIKCKLYTILRMHSSTIINATGMC